MTPELIVLDSDWECEWLELQPELYEFMRPERVPTLARWTFDRRRLENWAAYLYRDFLLDSAYAQVLLYIDAAPSPARVYLNGQAVGEYAAPGDDDPPFELDLTPCARPGRNHLAFRVPGDAEGRFQGVAVQPLRAGEGR